MSDIIGQMLMAMDPKIRPWDQAVKEGAQADTALIQLANLRRQQETAARTRQFLQEHPEILLGQGGGSVLGSLQTAPGGPPSMPGAGPMTQQQVMPGQPTPAPQMVPGGQDLSRYANVPPTRGGPIPPNVMGQVMPQVTPPQGTPTLATLGQPQGQQQALQHRFLLDLARTSPDAAMQVQQLMQGQQQYQSKLEEQRLDWTSKKMGYFGQVLQGVNSPESYGLAVQEIGRVDAQAAARLPQAYSKEGLQPYIKQALSVKDSADLQLRTMHEQTEQGKLQVQLAQAGYAGLGESVTSILRGLSEEQVKQFGGRTTAAAVAYATEEARKLKAPPGQTDAVTTELRKMGKDPWKAQPEDLTQAGKNIQERELAKAGEAERLKFAQEQEQQKTLPLQDARKEDAGLFVSKGTGQTIPGTTPYGQVKQLQDEKDPEKGVIKLANLDEKKQLTTLKQLEPVLQQYADLVQYTYGANGPLENYTRSPSSVLGAAAGQATQNDPVFQAKRRALQGQLQSVVRGLGARGDLNEQELAAAKEMIANMDASMGLGLNIGFGVGTGGAGPMVGVKPSVSIPDTPETGINLANELIGTVNRRIGSILQHEGYSKTPFITLRTNQQGQPQPGVMPQARPGSQAPPLTSTVPPRTWGTMPPATPGQPTPPAPGQGTAPAAPPTFGPGDPSQQLKPRQAPRTAPAPAPSAPATKPTPGRQSQAQPRTTGAQLARASGIKVMDAQDIRDAMEATGRSRAEVITAARQRGYTVYSGGGTAMA